MADLPQIPGSSGPPQIPGGSDYSAGRVRAEVPKVPITPETAAAERALPSTRPLARKKRTKRTKRILGPFRIAHLVIAVVIAVVGLARSSSEVKTPKITVPKIDMPKMGDTDATGGADAASVKVPEANVYRAAPGAVAGHARTIVELGVRRGKIRWIAASRFPTECDDGTSSGGLLFYTDEGTPRGTGNALRYEDDTLNVRFSPAGGRGSVRYRSARGGRTCRGTVTFRAERASKPLLAEGMLDADRRAAKAFGGG